MTDTPLRLSPMHSLLEAMKPTWSTLHEMPAAMDYGNPDAEASAVSALAICDASAFAKIGFKGGEAEAWLTANDVNVPAEIYDSAPLADDAGLVLRTGVGEFFIEDGAETEVVSRLVSALESGPANVFPVAHEEASVILSGERAVKVLAQTCGVNFADVGKQLVMSRVAGVSAAILPGQVKDGVPSFRLWWDCSYGVYLWEELVKIVSDLEGRAVGLAAFS